MKNKVKYQFQNHSFQFRYELINFLYNNKRMSVSEIAKKVGCSANVVRGSIHYIKQLSRSNKQSQPEVVEQVLSNDRFSYKYVEYVMIFHKGEPVMRLPKNLYADFVEINGVLYLD